jgi:aryl carrier-like protein
MVSVMDLLEKLKVSLYYRRKLKKVRERASLNPENLLIQVRMGDLLAKLKKKKEAVTVYELAAQQFIQKKSLRPRDRPEENHLPAGASQG